MRVLYFADEYYAAHGGRTHARSFFKELSQDPRVSCAEVFPPAPAPRGAGAPEAGARAPRRVLARHALERHARGPALSVVRWLPWRLSEELELLRPPHATYEALSAALSRGAFDVAVLRLSGRFRYLSRLRHDHPGCRLVVEYNASPFDERLKGVAGERLWRREEARQLAMADCIGVVSEYLRRYLVSLDSGLDGKVFVNPNGADPSLFPVPTPETRAEARRALGIPADALAVGYIGGMERWRRLPELVTWLGRCRQGGLDRLFVVVVGAGQDHRPVWARLADPTGGLAQRSFCSEAWLPAEQVPWILAALDCGLLSFQHPHCCAQKAFEYLLTGLPVLGPAGTVPQGLLSREFGTFEFGDGFAGLLEALERTQVDLAAFKTAALHGREQVVARFTWRANATRVLDALSSQAS